MQLVTVKTFDNYFTANIILTKLHAEGVECYLKDEYTVTLDPLLNNAIGGIKLVVKEKDAKQVQAILDRYEREFLESAPCPNCGSHNFAHIAKPSPKNFLTAIFTWLFTNFAVAPEYVYQCGSCGYETERLPQVFSDHFYHPN